jgi:hypothetical protein
MAQLRPYLLVLGACLVVQTGLLYLLEMLGAGENLAVAVAMIWLCLVVVLTLGIGGHFDHGDDER